jgi:hypothetical protein
MLIYECPQTKQMVQTSIETSEGELQRMGGLKISVWCPHCLTGHRIVAKDAWASVDVKLEPVG